MTNRALCIGINDYPGTHSDLSGCVNDANDWADVLHQRGYEIEMLLDAQATKAAIVDGMQDLIDKTGFGETAVITYSGHGTWVPDVSGDEPDKRDEALCPYDIFDAQLILDDELYDIFGTKRHGAHIVLISDSCHSGTVQRLVGPLGESRNKVRFLAPGVFMSKMGFDNIGITESGLPLRPVVSRSKARANRAVLLSGCQDWEYSYDAWFGDRANGAFTYVAVTALQNLAPGDTYEDWMASIRHMLPSQDYPQTPLLSGRSYMKRWEALPELGG